MFSQSITVISQLQHLQVRRTHQLPSGDQTIMILICPMHISPITDATPSTSAESQLNDNCQKGEARSQWKITQLKENSMITWSLK